MHKKRIHPPCLNTPRSIEVLVKYKKEPIANPKDCYRLSEKLHLKVNSEEAIYAIKSFSNLLIADIAVVIVFASAKAETTCPVHDFLLQFIPFRSLIEIAGHF